MNEIPVYIFTGFLEAGKTTFIKETLEDPQFNSGESTLVLACEDGEQQYTDLSEDAKEYLSVIYLEDRDELNADFLEKLEMETMPDRIMVEYNGLWPLADLYQAFPSNWIIAQQINIVDATTFTAYNTMFRSNMFEQISDCEFVLFNRVEPDSDIMPFHQVVRAISRRIQIAYEYKDGTGMIDDIEDPLPFDVDAPVIQIGIDDYALWMQDIAEDPKKYKGKKVHVTGNAQSNGRIKDGFSFGRPVMTCCVEDIRFMGFICRNNSKEQVLLPGWYDIEAEVMYDYQRLFGKKAPWLKAYKMTPVDPPENPVSTFY